MKLPKKSLFILDLRKDHPGRAAIEGQLGRYGNVVSTNNPAVIRKHADARGSLVGVVSSCPDGLDLGTVPVLSVRDREGKCHDEIEAWLFYAIAYALTTNHEISNVIREISLKWALSVRQAEFLAVLTHPGAVADQARVIGVTINTLKTITRRTLNSARAAEPERVYLATSDLLRAIIRESMGETLMTSTPASRGGRQKRAAK